LRNINLILTTDMAPHEEIDGPEVSALQHAIAELSNVGQSLDG
jgi:hypothetical protein